MFPTHLGKYLGVLLLDFMPMFIFVKTVDVSSKVTIPILHSHSNDWEFCCSTSSPVFGVVSVLVLPILIKCFTFISWVTKKKKKPHHDGAKYPNVVILIFNIVIVF